MLRVGKIQYVFLLLCLRKCFSVYKCQINQCHGKGCRLLFPLQHNICRIRKVHGKLCKQCFIRIAQIFCLLPFCFPDTFILFPGKHTPFHFADPLSQCIQIFYPRNVSALRKTVLQESFILFQTFRIHIRPRRLFTYLLCCPCKRNSRLQCLFQPLQQILHPLRLPERIRRYMFQFFSTV